MSSEAIRRVAVALVHYPVLDRDGGTITTAVTNLDVHDLSRSARAYGVSDFFVVHPIAAQRELVERVRAHWVDGAGGRRIPDRREALGLVRIVASLGDAVSALRASAGADVELWTTAARAQGEVEKYDTLRARLRTLGPPVLLLFGTGWGLPPEILANATTRVAPLEGAGTWNHLSVRAACAITLDRLLARVLAHRLLPPPARVLSAKTA